MDKSYFAERRGYLMAQIRFPVIDPVATGANIIRLRQERGLTVYDLQRFFGFDAPQAIYKWQKGQSLPSIDNLYALSALFQVSMNEILVSSSHMISFEQQDFPCFSNHFPAVWRAQEIWQNFPAAQALIRLGTLFSWPKGRGKPSRRATFS